MSDNKKYYYLKLKEDFFDSPEIKVLESMPNGYKYSNLLLKLYLKALKFDGALRLNEYIPYNVEMISAVVGMDIDTVRVAFDLFKKLKLVEILNDGTIYMLEIQNFIGKSTTEADRKRNYRKRIEEEKTKLIENGQMSGQMSLKCPDKTPPEKEIDIDIEKEKDKDIDKDTINSISSTEVQQIINTWNSLGLQNIKFIKNNTNRYKMLNARIKEYGIDTFLQAINNIRNSSFLKGQNNRNWTITFDWLIKPNNFIKVLEGNYDDKENKGGFNNESRSNTSKNNEPSKGESKEEHDAKYWEEQNRILNEMLDF